jgi:hypothetical protein
MLSFIADLLFLLFAVAILRRLTARTAEGQADFGRRWAKVSARSDR